MVDFSSLDLKNTSFESCEIFECVFMETNLSKANFEHCYLKGSTFQNSNLSFASFKSAQNYSIDPNQNTLKKTKFSSVEAIGLLDVFDIELE